MKWIAEQQKVWKQDRGDTKMFTDHCTTKGATSVVRGNATSYSARTDGIVLSVTKNNIFD